MAGRRIARLPTSSVRAPSSFSEGSGGSALSGSCLRPATGARSRKQSRRGLPSMLCGAELTPDQKVMVVLSERNAGPVMMIGDDVNDAPALVAADVGIAMGANGAAASAVRRRCRSSPGPRG